MVETIVMIHGMWGGPWYWGNYKKFFEDKGLRWTPSVGQDRGLTKREFCHSYSVCYQGFYHIGTSILHVTGVHFRWCPIAQ